jgi:hypothetical protein
MTKVEVKDSVLWTKHLHGDAELRARLESLRAGDVIQLRVDGEVGEWRKMQDNSTTGKPTPGLAPIGPAALRWRELFRANKASGGIVVGVEAIEADGVSRSAAPANWEDANEMEREAAWEAFKALRNAGWSSEGRTLTRDELHEREPR